MIVDIAMVVFGIWLGILISLAIGLASEMKMAVKDLKRLENREKMLIAELISERGK